MGYFSNQTENDLWRVENCDKCVHGNKKCPIELAHLLYNYRDCNDDESILHLLIPRSKDGRGNKKCGCFVETSKAMVKEMKRLKKVNDYLEKKIKRLGWKNQKQ